MSAWRQVVALLWKEMRAEARTRETITPMLVFCLLVVTVFGFALGPGRDLNAAFPPGLLWVSFYFAGLLGSGRSFAGEKAADTLPGLMLAPGERTYIFLGKAGANFLFLLGVEMITAPLFFALLGMGAPASPARFVLVLVLGTLAFACVGTFMAALAVNMRAAEMLLPILVFPVMVPAVIATVEATRFLLEGSPGGGASWIRLLVAYDALFLALTTVLFDHVLEV